MMMSAFDSFSLLKCCFAWIFVDPEYSSGSSGMSFYLVGIVNKILE